MVSHHPSRTQLPRDGAGLHFRSCSGDVLRLRRHGHKRAPSLWLWHRHKIQLGKVAGKLTTTDSCLLIFLSGLFVGPFSSTWESRKLLEFLTFFGLLGLCIYSTVTFSQNTIFPKKMTKYLLLAHVWNYMRHFLVKGDRSWRYRRENVLERSPHQRLRLQTPWALRGRQRHFEKPTLRRG